MANQIRITPDQMRERATQYRNEADTVNGVIGKMDSLLQQLQGEWEGEASRAYGERFGQLRFANAGGAYHENILGVYFFPHFRRQLGAAVAVTQGNGYGTLSLILADDIAVQFPDYFTGG